MGAAEVQDDDLFDLSDEELEAAFKEAKAQEDSPETAIEEAAEEEIDNEEIDIDTGDEEVEVEEEIDEDSEEEEDLEQPENQDSDSDTSSEEEEEEESDEDSDDKEGEPDEEPEESDEDPAEEEEESGKEEQPIQEQPLTFKANGQEYTFSNDEMKQQFGKVFGQAMDYTKKMQQIKPWRKTIDAIEQAELSNDDVSLMIDVLKGDKDAITEVLKRTGTDALDLDTENTNYVTKDYGRNDTELAIKDIVDEISGDTEYSVTHDVLEKRWDDSSRDEFIKDPELIKLLHIDVKSGMFDTVNPMAQKLKVFDSGKKSDLEYYKLASKQYFESEAQKHAQVGADEQAKIEAKKVKTEKAKREAADAAEAEKLKKTKAEQAKRKATKQASTKRKAAAPAKKAAGTKKVTDYLDDSEEAFDEWYKNLQDSQ